MMAEELESNPNITFVDGTLLEWLGMGDEGSPIIDPLAPGSYSVLGPHQQDHDALWDATLPAEIQGEGCPDADFLVEPSFSSNNSAGPDSATFEAQPPMNATNTEDCTQAAKKRKQGATASLDGKNSTVSLPYQPKGRRQKASENNAASPNTGESAHQDSHYSIGETPKFIATRLQWGSGTLPDSEPTGNNSSSNNESNTKGKFGGQLTNPSSKESRWAEQLLNPCAIAIATNNTFRIQHLIWVLHDLASASGDANHRLASHGLRALTAKITRVGGALPCSDFLSADPKAFLQALIKFHEVSPWYQFVYTIANGALLEAFEDQNQKTFHVIDIGISHGIQWPTFIEALARRSSGPPNLLRLTVIADTLGAPFSAGPPSNDFPKRLEKFAKSLNLNMEVNIIAQPLESLSAQTLGVKEDEALAICAQFRLHQLLDESVDRNEDEDSLSCVSPRNRFIKFARDLNPILFVLSDNDADHSSPEFLIRFQQSVDHMWRFLDSTSVCFKGRECEERRLVEGEAAMGLLNNVVCEGACRVERNENRLKWGARAKEGGFVYELLSDEILDSGRTLLRKHDSNWGMHLDDGCVTLCWKNHPVSFCSLWKP